MKIIPALLFCALTSSLSLADEPDGLQLPPGFHASIVAEGLGPVRHLAVRDNGDIYVSTLKDKQGAGGGIIALHLDAHHKADQTMRFGTVDGGTGIRFHRGALYAASSNTVYRFKFQGNALVPAAEPEVIIDGMPSAVPGFGLTNRLIAFDDKGGLFVGLNGGGNICTDPNAPKDANPSRVEALPAPSRASRGVAFQGGQSPDKNSPATASNSRQASGTSPRLIGPGPTATCIRSCTGATGRISRGPISSPKPTMQTSPTRCIAFHRARTSAGPIPTTTAFERFVSCHPNTAEMGRRRPHPETIRSPC